MTQLPISSVNCTTKANSLKDSEQYYDEEAHTFLADRYITGECPRCHAEGAYGDQCEKCGSTLSPTELINPKSAISGSKTGYEGNQTLVSAA